MINIFNAIESGNIKEVTDYVYQGGNIKLKNNDGSTLLHYAAICEQTGIFQYLLAHGADVNEMDKEEYTPLLTACTLGNEAIVRMIIESGRLSKTDTFYLPMHVAAYSGHDHIIEYLFHHGYDVNQKDQYGRNYTPLCWAVQENRLSTVRLLIQLGADVTLANDEGFYPLYIAAGEGWKEIASVLIRCGSRLDGVNDSLCSPLIIACVFRNLPIVKILVAHHADINRKDDDGRSALFHAVLHNDPEIEAFLIDNGADVDIIDNNGHSLDFARKNREALLNDPVD